MRKFIWAALPLAAVVAVYGNSFPGDFHYDDYGLMLENSRVQAERFDYTSFLDQYGGRPLTLWFFHWERRLFGENPLGYHIVNLLLHLAVTLLVFLLIRSRSTLMAGRLRGLRESPRSEGLSRGSPRWGSPRWEGPKWEGPQRPDSPNEPIPTLAGKSISAASSCQEPDESFPFLAVAASLIFALHPLQTQSVNYIWSRSMLLMGVFSLAALLAARRSWKAAAVLSQLAIWSRASGIVGLVFLFWIDPRRWKVWAGLALANLAAFTYSLITYAPTEVAWNHSALFKFLLAQPAALLQYASLMFRPTVLQVDHFFEPPSWLVAAAIPVVGLAVLLVHQAGRRHPAILLGAVWMVAWLAPTMAIPNDDLINESRMYLSFLGPALAAAYALNLARKRWGAAISAALLALLLCLLLPFTLERNRIWRSDLTLYEDAARKTPHHSRVQYNLGSALARDGRLAEAEQAFRTAAQLQPDDDLSYAAIGYCLEMRRHWKEAMEAYRQALRLNPQNGRATEGLARLASTKENLL